MSQGLVYKYSPIREGKGAIEYLLENQQFKFSRPSGLNDINEVCPKAAVSLNHELGKYSEEAFRLYAKGGSLVGAHSPEEFAERVLHMSEFEPLRLASARNAWNVMRERFEGYAILSLSRTASSLLMWAHYASDSTKGAASGLCLGFRRDSKVFLESQADERIQAGLLPVRYKRERAGLSAPTLGDRVKDVFLRKSLDWKYEQEERCLRKCSSELLPRFEVEDLQEIILGPNMPPADMLRCALLRESKFPHAGLFLALPNLEHFAMDVHCMEDPGQTIKLLERPTKKVPPLDFSQYSHP